MRHLGLTKESNEAQISVVSPVLALLLAIVTLRAAFHTIRTNSRKSII